MQRRQLNRRRALLADLLVEMVEADSVIQLYAGLLARTLVCTDQDLMREFGEQVVKMSARPDSQGKMALQGFFEGMKSKCLVPL